MLKEYLIESFWTAGLRDEVTDVWYWETTGNAFAGPDIYWGSGEPDIVDPQVQVCMSFSHNYAYNDDDCYTPNMNFICEYVTK